MTRIRATLMLLLAGLAITLAGCTVFKPERDQTVRAEARIGPGKVTPDEIQSNVMSFADHHSLRVVQALDELPMSELTLRQRSQVMATALGSRESVIFIAAGPNPMASMIDMLVTLQLTTDAMEWYLPAVMGDDAEIMLRAFRRSRDEAWAWSEKVLTPEQQDNLRKVIREWQERNPDEYFVTHVRFTDFAAFRTVSPTKDAGAENIFGVFYLDPFASLNPAAQEIARSRLLAERTIYYVQRLPALISGEAHLFANELLDTPSVTALLANADQISNSTEQFTALVEALPDQIAAEREAAVTQIAEEYREQTSILVDRLGERYRVESSHIVDRVSERMTEQREGLLASLESEEARLRGVLVELRGTIDASSELSASVDTTVTTVDRLMARLAENKHPDAPPLDIATSLTQATEMARELNVLVDRVDAIMASPAWTDRRTDAEGLLDATELRGGQLINRALRAGLILIGVFLVGAVVAMLVYRSLARRFFGPAPEPAA